MPGLEVFRRGPYRFGVPVRKLVRWSEMAHTNDLVSALSRRDGPLSFFFSLSLSLRLSFSVSHSVSFRCALVSRSNRPSSFDCRHKTASPMCSRLKSFSRHPLIKFRNRSSLFPSSLSAITCKSSTA